jgi:hypothetical protein
MERSFEKLSMLSSKTSVSAGHSALQNSWSREWKKKIRLWSTLFSSSTSKMIHVIEKKILPPFEKKKHEKKTFGLTTTCMDYFSSSQQRPVYKKKRNEASLSTRILHPNLQQGFQHRNSHLSTLESSIPASDTSIT